VLAITNKKPLVSIVIPCYNAEKYVGEAIESALNQKYSPIEVIVINDGSTDNSLEAIRNYEKLIYYETQANKGPSIARNRGLQISTASYIQFFDADDLLDPQKISKSLDEFSHEIGVVFTDQEEFAENDMAAVKSTVKSSIVKSFREKPASWKEDQVLESIIRLSVGTPLPLYRKELLHKYGAFREDLTILEDVELAFRLAINKVRFKRIPEKLVKVRRHYTEGRLRLVRDKSFLALQTIYSMRDQAMAAGMLNPEVKSALADQIANHGRKIYLLGYKDMAENAFEQAYFLNPSPKPTGVPLYNFFSNIFGLKKTEEFFMLLRKGTYKHYGKIDR